MREIRLRYGLNPFQQPARLYTTGDGLPLEVLNGSPSYVNVLDALNSWQLVRELKELTGLAAAASFKHVSPAGAAVAPALAVAYARARGADRMASFGDWAAFSDEVDEPTARILKQEVSDGCIAPGYERAALAILKEKKSGCYPVLSIDPSYRPAEIETRQVFGLFLEQPRNDVRISPDLLKRTVTKKTDLPEPVKRDMLVALVTLKYTQSNSVCLVYDGQVIGVGAGQQSRIHCTRIACAKADKWLLRQSPKVQGLVFKKGVSRADKANAIDLYLEEVGTEPDTAHVSSLEARKSRFETVPLGVLGAVPEPLSREEKAEWIGSFDSVVLGSDAFFPFRDNVDRAAQTGVRYAIQPGGSVRDEEVIGAADEHGMVMVFTGLRLFHH